MRYMLLCVLCFTCLQAQESLKFGVFPHMPLTKLHSVFDVVAMDIEIQINKPITLMTKPYYKLYKEELNRGVYDFAFIQPLDYIQANALQGYQPLARRAEDLKAIIVVSKASTYFNIDEIKEKVIAAAPSQAAVTKMMLSSLGKKGYQPLDDFTISYSKNHFICLQKVLDRKASACITAQRAVDFFNQEKETNDFRVLYESEALPHALFVVHPRVGEQTAQKIQERIIHWKEYEKGREMLQKGRLLNFIKADDSDYDRVREFMKD